MSTKSHINITHQYHISELIRKILVHLVNKNLNKQYRKITKLFD